MSTFFRLTLEALDNITVPPGTVLRARCRGSRGDYTIGFLIPPGAHGPGPSARFDIDVAIGESGARLRKPPFPEDSPPLPFPAMAAIDGVPPAGPGTTLLDLPPAGLVVISL